MRWQGFPFSYRDAGILGINTRNRDYILPHNPRKYYQRVDDKIETKRLAIAAGVACPTLYSVIEFQNQVKLLDEILEGKTSFVVKPAQGSGGDGIVVVHDTVESGYRKAGGAVIRRAEMRYHLYNILAGMHSLGGQTDKVLLEEVVHFDPAFDDISYQGVPDIRVIVFQGIPVMAMLRLPSRESDGKANLHKGGLGVGVDLATGRTHLAVHKGKYVTQHPETGASLAGRDIPHWQDILEMAVKFHSVSGLGYIGADIVLDRHKGPMLLEANARPGIAIQVANGEGLVHRLETARKALPDLTTPAEKIAFARQAFAQASALRKPV